MCAAPNRPGELQLRILEILWERREASVATMLRKMEARALVSHREEGRAFVYRAEVQPDDVARGASDHLVGRLFEGSVADAVSHLLTTRQVSRAELDQLEKLVRDAKRRTR